MNNILGGRITYSWGGQPTVEATEPGGRLPHTKPDPTAGTQQGTVKSA